MARTAEFVKYVSSGASGVDTNGFGKIFIVNTGSSAVTVTVADEAAGTYAAPEAGTLIDNDGDTIATIAAGTVGWYVGFHQFVKTSAAVPLFLLEPRMTD